jgi:MerR family transcriptional regulator/heat shock protein HspR
MARKSRSGSTDVGTEPTAVVEVGPSSWQDRLDDPDEPLFTLAITADLLGLDPQALRRLEDAIEVASRRPSGNQRRYSRADIEVLARAAELAREGHTGMAIARIMELERNIADLDGHGD